MPRHHTTSERLLRRSHEKQEKELKRQHRQELKIAEQEHKKELGLIQSGYEQEQSRNQQLSQEVEELREVKERLEKTKVELENQLRDMTAELHATKQHVSTTNDVISSLKKEHSARTHELDRLAEEHRSIEKELRTCNRVRQDWMKKSEKHEIDARTYFDEMKSLETKENAYHEHLNNVKVKMNEQKQAVHQCKLAIDQSKSDLRRQKEHFEHLQETYKENEKRLLALQEALKKCHEGATNSREVVAKLRSHYETAKHDLKRVQEEKQAAEAMSLKLQESKDKLEAQLSQCVDRQEGMQDALSTCMSVGKKCLSDSRARDQYVEVMEKEIRKALRAIKKHSTGVEPNSEEADVKQIAEEELKLLNDHLQHLHGQHQTLITELQNLHGLRDAYRHLHGKHSKAKQWLSHLHGHYKTLGKRESDTRKQMEEASQHLDRSNEKIQKQSARIADLEKQVEVLTNKARNCYYPGEKERVNKDIEQLLHQRDNSRESMEKMIDKHQVLHQKLQELINENKDLKAIKERYAMDLENLQRMTEQSASISVELDKAEKQLSKKSKQLELMGMQLGTVMQRVKMLEEREVGLKEQLKQSTSPEETDAMQQKITNCRQESRDLRCKFDKLKEIAHKLYEQQKVNEERIRSLVSVLQTNETAKMDLENERAKRMELEASLQACREERKLETKELEARLKAVEDQYKHNLLNHEKLMMESQARILNLEQQIHQAREQHRKDAVSQAVAQGQVPMTEQEREQEREQIRQQVLRNTEREVAELKKKAKDPEKLPDVAVQAAESKHVKELQALQAQHQQEMREKEREIMALRGKTYNELLQALERVNKNPNAEPQTVYDQVRDIRDRGQQREQQAMQDMLRLRALNQQISTQYQEARNAQQGLLNQGLMMQQQRINQLAQQPSLPPPVLMQESQRYQQLGSAQAQVLLDQRNDAFSQLQSQQAYIRDLEMQVPRMNSVLSQVNTMRFPSLQPLANQVSQERQYALGALNQENEQAISQARSTSVLESQLKALNASVRANTEATRLAAQNPNENNRNLLLNASSMTTDQIRAQLDHQQQLGDRSAVRMNYMLRDQPKGKSGLQIDPMLNRVLVPPTGSGPPLPKVYHANYANYAPNQESLSRSFAPTLSRMGRSLQEGGDLVVVSYTHATAGETKEGNSLQYLLFDKALDQIWNQVSGMSPSGTVLLQMVRVQAGDVRDDMLSANRIASGCSYADCGAATVVVQGSVEAVKAQIRTHLNAGTVEKQAKSHVILTLGIPEKKDFHVHLTDVMYSGGKEMDTDTINLVDHSWVVYLRDVIQKPSTKIDLFFDLLPGSDPSITQSNERLLEVSRRLQAFLDRSKQL